MSPGMSFRAVFGLIEWSDPLFATPPASCHGLATSTAPMVPSILILNADKVHNPTPRHAHDE